MRRAFGPKRAPAVWKRAVRHDRTIAGRPRGWDGTLVPKPGLAGSREPPPVVLASIPGRVLATTGRLEVGETMAYTEEPAMTEARQVRLFRNGRDQAVCIPVEFELPGEAALMHREGSRLVIEPIRKRGLLALLATLDPIEEDFADFDEGLRPSRDIEL